MIKIGIVGAGKWGRNHVRVLNEIASEGICEFVGIADYDPNVANLAVKYGVKYFDDYKKMVKKVDGVIIAVPPVSLYKTARYFLKHGVHVLTEKPFALNLKQGNTLVEMAEKANLKLMVGHVFLYNPVLDKIKNVMETDDLGEVFYGYSQRLNLGTVRGDVNALWNFGPHDISIFMYLFNSRPIKVWASGQDYLQNKVEDVVFLGMEFPNGAKIQCHLSWIDPIKTRKVTMVGNKAMLIWDDVDQEMPLQIFNKSVVFPENWDEMKSSKSFGEFKFKTRFGDAYSPYVPFSEPLKNEQGHFIQCIEQNKKPKTNGEHALDVLRVLLAGEKSLRKEGRAYEP